MGNVMFTMLYLANATKMATVEFAEQWQAAYPMMVGEIAARWASYGYMPEEARVHIRAGRSPEQANRVDAKALGLRVDRETGIYPALKR